MGRLRRTGFVLVLLVLVVVGAWAAPRVAGPRDYATAVADVQVRLSVTLPQRRGVNLYVPLADWGLRSYVTRAPVRVTVEPRRINRVGVVRTVSDGGRGTVAELRSQLDGALRSATWRFLLLSVLGGLLGGLVALLVWHVLGVRGRWLLLAPGAGVALTAVTVGGLIAWTALSFDATRLERPEYYASGVELERILEQADSLRRSGAKYSDRVDNAVRGITGLLNDRGAGANPLAPADPGGLTQRVALASDIHNNLLTLPTLRRYAQGHLTVLAGDFTINGGQAETPLLDRMATVGDPVVAVSGNHDSPGIMRGLERRGVTVLEHEDGVKVISGLAMAGFEDPLMFAKGQFPRGLRAGISFGDIPDGHERFVAAVEERWQWWQALAERPDVLVVHQAAIGRELASRIRDADPEGAPVAILVGHTHRQRLDRFGPVTVIDSGSIGAGGLFGIGEQNVGLALLDFRSDGSLEAADLVSLNPSTSAARARRVITDSPDCDGELVGLPRARGRRYAGALSACSRSATRSSGSSMPHDSRTRSAGTAASEPSTDWWVIACGTSTSDSTPPSDSASANSLVAPAMRVASGWRKETMPPKPG